jgi:hypothetical protein
VEQLQVAIQAPALKLTAGLSVGVEGLTAGLPSVGPGPTFVGLCLLHHASASQH